MPIPIEDLSNGRPLVTRKEIEGILFLDFDIVYFFERKKNVITINWKSRLNNVNIVLL